MAAITSITENWSGHSFKEVETHIKGSYLPLTSVSVDSISSGVANVLTLNSSNAVKKTSLSDLASLLGGGGSFMKDGYNGDANELVEAGVYCCWGETTNLPTNGSGGFIMVLSPLSDPDTNNKFVIQIYFDSYSTKATGEIYTRMRWASTNWEPWRDNHE